MCYLLANNDCILVYSGAFASNLVGGHRNFQGDPSVRRIFIRANAARAALAADVFVRNGGSLHRLPFA